jgi:hypothetical protein
VLKLTLKYYITLFLLAWISIGILAQETLYTDDYRINPENNGSLFLSIDNISFFRNVETDGDIFDGYTLPGFRFTPRVILHPASMLKLEAGLSLLKFWGAEKYPCYAYRDISEWKAGNYQYGFHLLPFFRARIQPIKQINIVLGNIYGGSNHEIIEPLYNPELNLTADPESGVQFLYQSKVAKVDIWANWENFIFKNDTHQEVMIFGGSAALNITPENSIFHISLPAQFIGIHHGGELKETQEKLTTMYNATAGLKFQFNTNRLLRNISFQSMGISYRCIDNHSKFPFSDGWALYTNFTAQLWRTKIKAGWWRSREFINLFGNPVFQNTSLTLPEFDRVFPKIDVFNLGFSYEQPFENGIYLGSDLDFYHNPKLKGYDLATTGYSSPSKISKSFNCSFGVYLRINPSIILKKKLF